MSAGVTWGASFGGAAVSSLRVYDELMVPRLFAPWAQLLVDQLEIAPGEAVLDVACGPGSVTRIAAERAGAAGRVKGCDLSPAMLAIAAAKPATQGAAPIEYFEGPADQLPAQDEEFDVVTCQQGLQFFPDRRAAVAAMRRALRPGGRLGVAVWTEIEHSPPFFALANAIGEVAGTELADRYRAGPWGFSDGERLGTLLEEAGFVDVRMSSHVLPVAFDGGPAQLAATLGATPLAAELDQLADDQRQALIDALARQVGDGAIESQLESNIALARR